MKPTARTAAIQLQLALCIAAPLFLTERIGAEEANEAPPIADAAPATAPSTGAFAGVPFGEPNDIFLTEQWALKALDVYRADEAPTLSPVVVAVIDTGLDFLHPDLGPANQWRHAAETANGLDDDANGFTDDLIGWNFVDQNNVPWDQSGHGTHVAGVIAATANNGTGVAGIAPSAQIMALKVANFAGHAKSTAIAAAIHYAVGNGARIINLSLGGPAVSQVETRALEAAAAKGVLAVVSAGNTASTEQFGYAAIPSVLTVGASAKDDTRATFSNVGVRLDVVAPGVDILSLRARGTDFLLVSHAPDYAAGSAFVGEGRYYRASGTSFATAVATGVAARLLATRPELTGTEVKQMLVQSAKDLGVAGVDQLTGYGRIDYRAALAQDPKQFIAARIVRVEPTFRDAAVHLIVTGDADADAFAGATLEAGNAAGDSWKPVGSPLTQPVGGGVLGDVDLAELLALGPGSSQWQLRLIVKHTNGATRESRIRVSLPTPQSAPAEIITDA